jgi:hypothetical protein
MKIYKDKAYQGGEKTICLLDAVLAIKPGAAASICSEDLSTII